MLRRLTSWIADAGSSLRGDKGALARVDLMVQEAARLHGEARRALALALAENDRETKRIAEIAARADDLETRAVAALRAGRDDLAASAAETIARLETERRAAEEAAALYAGEVAKLRAAVDTQRRRLASLDQGRRLARVGAALGGTAPLGRGEADGFAAAEDALAALRTRQADAAAVAAFLAPPEERLVKDMAAAGFGASLRVEATAVMARLRDKARPAPLAIANATA